MKLKENQNSFSSIAHNFFGFNIFFLIKAIGFLVWQTRDVNIGASGLTNINFANIGSQVKFIDSMKYCQTGLGKFASIIDEIEKKNVEKLVIQFLNQHGYFSRIWKILNPTKQKKVIDIIVCGKGVIPCKKINSIESLNIKQKKRFFLPNTNFIAP